MQKLPRRNSKVAFLVEHGSLSTAGSDSGDIPDPTDEYFTGLEPLECTDGLFVVEMSDELPSTVGIRVRSHFRIYNADGKHIFTAAQTDPPFWERKFVMYIFAIGETHLEPIVRVGNCHRHSGRKDPVEMKETQAFMEQDRKIANMIQREKHHRRISIRDPRGFIHIQHLEKGIMGSIVRDKRNFQIYGKDLQDFVTVPIKLPRIQGEELPMPRSKVWFFKTTWNYYEYYTSVKGNTLPELPLGRVGLGIEYLPPNLKDVRGFIDTECCSATFPLDFTPAEKFLILGFALSLYCRRASASESCYRLGFLFAGAIILAGALVLGVGVVCKLTDIPHCNVFH